MTTTRTTTTRTTTTFERRDDLECVIVTHTLHLSQIIPNLDDLVHTFYIRDDMSLRVQRVMLDDAMYEMFGDNATQRDVAPIMRELKRLRTNARRRRQRQR